MQNIRKQQKNYLKDKQFFLIGIGTQLHSEIPEARRNVGGKLVQVAWQGDELGQ